jgi:hypothetical protein
MKLEHIAEGIYHAIGETPKELGMSFVRPQEHYESSKFRGKIFTFDEFKDWWIHNPPKGVKPGRFTYCTYYEGFNIPSDVLKPFFQGEFNPLSFWENLFLDKVSVIPDKKFYLIGTRKNGKPEDLKHEMAHGFYYTSPEYKKKVQAIVREVNPDMKNKLNQYLHDENYHPAVFNDERQAYILAGDDLKDAGIKLKDVMPIHVALNEVYNETLEKRRK